ncbi:hypothetical protein FDI24_gp158 [Acidovorax phage ACP17]|uniref:Uncharacterized protein n=1 Tax=Acidovorax phage ACP17 TaxID=2010329 RepID=A0A218M318_9CAUD|nr:hypothetical protein FDI24_gp158 [Acidovorax phage ACP17]ASD50440.1 hypothetical protein [Acidovorax phage ACP17]
MTNAEEADAAALRHLSDAIDAAVKKFGAKELAESLAYSNQGHGINCDCGSCTGDDMMGD